MTYFTSIQHDNAREEVIAAFEGYLPRHGDQYQTHGIYAVSSDDKRLMIAGLEALGLDASHLKVKPKVGGQVTRATQKVRGHSKMLVNDKVFDQAKLLRAISKIDPVHRAWVEAIYFSGSDENLYRSMTGIYNCNYRTRKGTEQKVAMLIKLAIRQAIAIALDHQQIKAKQISIMLGINEASYRDSWKAKFELLVQAMTDMDTVFLDYCCYELGYNVYLHSIKPSKPKRFAHLMA